MMTAGMAQAATELVVATVNNGHIWLATLPQTPANFERVCVRPPIEKTFTPDRADTTLHDLLAKRYARFRALYQATKPLMVAC
jgi:hypothetical protein